MMQDMTNEAHCLACGSLLTALRVRENQAVANGCRCETPQLDPTRRYGVAGWNGAFTLYEVAE